MAIAQTLPEGWAEMSRAVKAQVRLACVLANRASRAGIVLHESNCPGTMLAVRGNTVRLFRDSESLMDWMSNPHDTTGFSQFSWVGRSCMRVDETGELVGPRFPGFQ